ncbi:unnamed protein product [Cuscuta campestris]|uniref:Pinin/SDK/MemA protein domain-containing protein n=2 Tax=Cuscuta sect. Cleistogrammica TaxID=1824901 RepID=A0A484M144_9ASTE|nr:hypothetical protein DM860_012922 [Cuscuta australis]VFQ81798.1 unnamed protein product [Cuscuta campestris]
MASAVVEKTEEELKKEIDELNRQRREITERLRDPRGIRRGGFTGSGPRNIAANGGRQRGVVRPAEGNDAEDQTMPKRRLLSAVVKVEDGEIVDSNHDAPKEKKKESIFVENAGKAAAVQGESRPTSWNRRDESARPFKRVSDIPSPEHAPRVLPKDEDPKLVSRNKRMLGQLLGTLEKFRKEDMQRSGSEAYMRRSDSLKRAEQKAREESERLRQQEREQIVEKRKRDLILRARIAAKAEEKRMELLFLKWSEHKKRLGNFIRTEAQPPIYYMFAKPLDDNAILTEQKKEQIFQEWKAATREELSQYQKKVSEEYLSNVEKETERWQNWRRGNRRANNNNSNSNTADLQETMDKELETHRLEHGPKTRKIPGSDNNDYDDDVEDINVAEDDMIMDGVLEVDDNNQRVGDDETAKTEGQ